MNVVLCYHMMFFISLTFVVAVKVTDIEVAIRYKNNAHVFLYARRVPFLEKSVLIMELFFG